MFSFDEDDVDFFLPQLLTLYINMHDVAEATHPYIVYRSRAHLLLLSTTHSVTLLLLVLLLLKAFVSVMK